MIPSLSPLKPRLEWATVQPPGAALMFEELECRGVGFTTEIFVEGLDEDLVLRGGVGEERHAGSKLQIVGITEDFARLSALDTCD